MFLKSSKSFAKRIKSPSQNVHPLKGFTISVGVLIVCFIVCFILLFKYGDDTNNFGSSGYLQVAGMGIIGFGFLSSFLRRYAYSGLGINYLMYCMIILESVIIIGVLTHGVGFQKVPMDFKLLLQGQYCAVAGLVSIGAMMGRLSPHQLLWVLMFQVPLYVLNMLFIGQMKLYFFKFPSIQSVDIGGGLYVHVFGAYYGLIVSYLFSRRGSGSSHPKLVSTYSSDIQTIMGTFVLFVLWPTLNSIWTTNQTDQFYASINTILSLIGSCISTFVVSIMIGNKIEITHVQNASLAGGVAMAAGASLIINPGSAILIGVAAGILSTVSMRYFEVVVELDLGIHDTRGVHNLHGLPGLLGALVVVFLSLQNGNVWVHEIISIAITLGCAIIGGTLSGIIVRQFDFKTTMTSVAYEDGAIWQDVDPDEEQMEYQPLV